MFSVGSRISHNSPSSFRRIVVPQKSFILCAPKKVEYKKPNAIKMCLIKGLSKIITIKPIKQSIENIALNKIKRTLKKAIPEAENNFKKLKGLVPGNILTVKAKNLNPLYVKDLKKVINDEPYIKEFSGNTKASDFYKKVEKGETVVLGEKVGFVKQNNLFEPYKVEKETFKKLFPPGKRYYISQNQTGNCYLLAGLYKKMENPKEQHEIYKMFEQNGDKITVTLPNFKKHPVEFDLTDQKWSNHNTLADSCLGNKMIELTYAINKFLGHFTTSGAKNLIEKGIKFSDLSKRVTSGHMNEAMNELFEKSQKNKPKYGSIAKDLKVVAKNNENYEIIGIQTKSKLSFVLNKPLLKIMPPMIVYPPNIFIRKKHALSATVDKNNKKVLLTVDPHNTLRVKRRNIRFISNFLSSFITKQPNA